MFEQTFKNIDDVLWKEAGCTTELDYTEQTSWMLFLKYLDDLERARAMEAELVGRPYDFIIDAAHRWSRWAAPKKPDGGFDHDNALTGDDLIAYVDDELFPYLKGFKQRAASPDTIEYKIGEIFSEIKNRFRSGYSLRDALELMDALHMRSQVQKHELSALYEEKIARMGNAGRNGGEYYTPRPLIRAMIQVTRPRLGERVYDGACGSAGFLCEAHDFMRHEGMSASELETLQTRTFYGKEKKSLAYVIAIMNLILHGIDAPNIIRTNTLAENIADIQERDRFDVILANPPFGGKERKEVQQNFPIKTGETAFPNGSLDCERMNYITRDKFVSLRGGKTQPGDLVYCLRGATIGKTAFVEPYTEGSIASSLMIIRPGDSISRFFLYFYLTSELGRQQIRRFENGAAQPNLGGKSVAKFEISLPPLHIQREIVNRLHGLDEETQRLEALYTRKINALTELKQSLLQKAFSGQLTAREAAA